MHVLFTHLGKKKNTDYFFVQLGNLFLEPRRSVFTVRCELDLLCKVNSVLKLWWTKGHCDRFLLYVVSPFIFIFTYALLLPVGQTVEAWEPSKNNALSEIEKHVREKYFHIFPCLGGII